VLGLGIVTMPLICGIVLAAGISRAYRPNGVALVPFILFIGISMAVTAFPVLVRILAEHNLIKSRIGALGLTSAGMGDAIVWCLLIVVVALTQGDSVTAAIPTVALLILFAVVIWTVIRRALRQLLTFVEKNAVARASSAAVLLLSALSGAFITDWIGVHTILGAFLVGMTVPRENPIVREVTRSITRVVAIALPLFFTAVGLNVRVDSLPNLRDLLVCGLIIVLAVTSKIGTTILIARSIKLSWREAVGLGIMVNCRGLTELVVVSTGLSLGIIGQDLFVMFVVMTLVTTIMTGPLLGWIKLDSEGPAAE
jgi:K+:H+ antiporter